MRRWWWTVGLPLGLFAALVAAATDGAAWALGVTFCCGVVAGRLLP